MGKRLQVKLLRQRQNAEDRQRRRTVRLRDQQRAVREVVEAKSDSRQRRAQLIAYLAEMTPAAFAAFRAQYPEKFICALCLTAVSLPGLCEPCLLSRRERQRLKEDRQRLRRFTGTTFDPSPEGDRLLSITQDLSASLLENGMQVRDWRATLLKDPCSFCGGESHTLDHIEPFSMGGVNTIDNATGMCSTCNVRKGQESLLAAFAAHQQRAYKRSNTL